VRNANAFYVSEKNTSNNTWEWKEYCGNVKELKVNENASEEESAVEITPNAKIPYLTPGPEPNTYYVKITGKSRSILYDNSTEDFPLILNVLTGPFDNGYQYYDNMSPASRSTSMFSLRTDTENSVGQVFAKPYLELISNYEPVSCQFLLPLHQFIEVMNLLKPQDIPTSMQKRWIMVNNIKMLPIKMTFEFNEGKNTVKAEIKMANLNLIDN
jgi:hypothetical protein